MGLENLKSIFKEDLTNNIESFSSNVITNVNDTKLTQFTTPELSKLIGQSPLEGMSWESLYDSNHSPKDNPSHKGLAPINYPNASRDKLDIRNNETRSSIFSPSRTQLLGFGAGEPYIISDIPTNASSFKGGRLLNQGPLLGIPVNRMITDTLRIGKYLTSPSGLLFIAKQNFLGENTKNIYISKNGELQSARQRFKKAYNPLSTLLQTFGRAGFGPAGLVDKTEPGLSSLFGSDEYPNTNLIGGNVNHNINDTFTDGTTSGGFNFSDFGKQLLNTVKGLNGAPSTIKSKSSGGDKMTLAKIVGGSSTDKLNYDTTVAGIDITVEVPSILAVGVNVEGEENGMPFYFKDMRDNTYVFFRAYIEGLSENISPSYNSTQYIGRSEPVYTYGSTEREINFTLKLFAQTKDELGKIYEKMNKLTSLCYPEYFKDEGVSYGNRMKAPLTKLRIGDMFGSSNSELQGYIKSLSYSVDQASPYETEVGKRVPKFVTANIGYQVIHSTVPNLETKFYGYIGD